MYVEALKVFAARCECVCWCVCVCVCVHAKACVEALEVFASPMCVLGIHACIDTYKLIYIYADKMHCKVYQKKAVKSMDEMHSHIHTYIYETIHTYKLTYIYADKMHCKVYQKKAVKSMDEMIADILVLANKKVTIA